jgi:hypothetical protein
MERGRLIFDPERMAALFDMRLEKIYQILDSQFQSMEQLDRTRGRNVRHIVLTGGLRSNLYVKEKLEERYCGDGFSQAGWRRGIPTRNHDLVCPANPCHASVL